MKKISLLAMVALSFALFLSSCKKEEAPTTEAPVTTETPAAPAAPEAPATK